MITTLETHITPFSGTYDLSDVQILLKPARILSTPVAEKEKLIQSGAAHYSEMLSSESVPDERYMRLYRVALARNASRLKMDVHHLARRIASRPETKNECVIVSLARAGTPIGVLLKRELERTGVQAHHYSVSIIRGRGIDENALRYIKERHGTETAVFVDGWTGKGAITKELVRSLETSDLGFKPFLAVVADPAGCAHLAATTEDYVIPSGLLNGIVSGLISRSVLNDTVVGPGDFHACRFMSEHGPHDISSEFIECVEASPLTPNRKPDWNQSRAQVAKANCEQLLADLMAETGVSDVNRIKPGIAEATRAILRRVPDRLYVSDLEDPEIQHLVHLATQADVPIEERDLSTYRAVTIIKKVGGDQE
ncbi:cysteine protease StiP family protein [Novosphingobium profundi]|uniref:cysteine protease StiP family protein n=1 Tax=Novosphingobium profundi TaxID=1774954 RepID=UPI001BDA65EF|nr:cysteine protease StiP family protein [Novosphingobium profundi]MBT0671472.1 cysteine protease StiP family protein [Novosphingobium profundi]